jgi:hypothetical protein
MIRRLLRLFATKTVRVASDELTVTDELHVWDAEDHGPELTATEQAIIDQLRARPLPEPDEDALRRIRDQLVADIQAGVAQPRPVTPLDMPTLADDRRARQVTARAVVDRRDEPVDWVREGDRWVPAPAPDAVPVPDGERPSPLTADELEAEIAAYEAGAAERARRAGYLGIWPAAPAAAGIARYETGGTR